MTLDIRKLTVAEAFEGLLSEWRQLDSEISPRTPFTSPMWHQLWWRHFARRNSLKRDEFFVHAVRDAGGRLVAVVPLVKIYRPGYGPIRLCKIQFFGADPSLTEIRGLVCRPERQKEVVEALLNYFKNNDADWDIFKWSGVRTDVGAERPLEALERSALERSLPDYVVKLPGSWEEFHSRLSNNTRKSLRKGYEFIDRDGHKLAFRVIDQRDGLKEALHRFLALHKARSQADDMAYHRDNFAIKRHRDFLKDAIDGFAVQGCACAFEMYVDGKLAATRLAFAFDNELYLYFSGFDPEWKQYGVMTTLVVEIIKWAIERKFELLNLSTGKDLSKLRWKPDEITFQDITQPACSLRGQLALRAESWLRNRSKSAVTTNAE
jgi:CelD/BcsL family acetyltransferase involved in cellulose biosynthesis